AVLVHVVGARGDLLLGQLGQASAQLGHPVGRDEPLEQAVAVLGQVGLGLFEVSRDRGGHDRNRSYRRAVADDLDFDAMVARFKQRAAAVRSRGVPPLEGAERRRFIEQAQLDYQDYAMLGDAKATLEDGFLVLRVDLRPPDASGEGENAT